MKITAVRVRKLVSGPGYALAVKHSLDTIGLAYGLSDEVPF